MINPFEVYNLGVFCSFAIMYIMYFMLWEDKGCYLEIPSSVCRYCSLNVPGIILSLRNLSQILSRKYVSFSLASLTKRFIFRHFEKKMCFFCFSFFLCLSVSIYLSIYLSVSAYHFEVYSHYKNAHAINHHKSSCHWSGWIVIMFRNTRLHDDYELLFLLSLTVLKKQKCAPRNIQSSYL